MLLILISAPWFIFLRALGALNMRNKVIIIAFWSQVSKMQ